MNSQIQTIFDEFADTVDAVELLLEDKADKTDFDGAVDNIASNLLLLETEVLNLKNIDMGEETEEPQAPDTNSKIIKSKKVLKSSTQGVYDQ